MESIFVKARSWGNSVGIIIPKELGVKPDEEILIKVTKLQKHGRVRDVWGMMKKRTGDTQKILDELNEELQ